MIAIGVLSVLAFTSACNRGGGSSDESIDTAGNCTSSFVHDYNMTLIELRSVADGYGNVQTTKNACAKFLQNHGSNISCKAEVNYQTATINAADITNACAAL